MSYPRYTWVGNKISEEDMAAMYRMKLKSRKLITAMVAEAVSQYVKEVEK
jgi:predicted Mrr-cat superfamily restriction endonuclease